MERIIAGLDLGTSKIRAAVASFRPGGHVEFLGVNELPSRGVSRGNVVDLADASSTVESLMGVIKEEYNPKVFKVALAVGGVGCSLNRARASIVLHGSPKELTQHDVERVTQTARNINFSLERHILHEVVEDYILDGQEGVKKPVGLFAKKLELRLYTLFQNVAHIQNAIKCINYAGYDVENIHFSGLVAMNCMINEEEKKDGLIFIDIGEATTKIIATLENKIKFCDVLGIGGADITRALSSTFKLPFSSAEGLKLDSTVTEGSFEDDKISMVISGRQSEVSKSEINDIVRKKADEALSTIKRKLSENKYADYVRSGMVISGGGALLNGLPEKMENIFDLPVRIGNVHPAPPNIDEPSHLFAPAIGALQNYTNELRQKGGRLISRNPITKLTHKITTFINDYF